MTQHQVPGDLKIRLRSLAQQLMTVLSERIRTGQLSHGDKLPTESQLMAEQGLSRTVVREAISRLNAAGLVETRHGIGTFVLGPSTDAFQIDVFAIKTIREVLDVLELRIALEVESAGLAAHRRSDAQLADMRSALDELNDKSTHAVGAASADFRFHLCIAQASGNRYFADLVHHLGAGIIPRSRIDSARIARQDQASYTLRLQYEHEAIYAAIVRRDLEGARMAMYLHLIRSKAAFWSGVRECPAT